MRLRDAFAFLVGSVVVYVACAAHPSDQTATGLDSGVSDAKADDASASPKPLIDDVKCDKSYATASGTLWYAEHAYAGRSKEDLARGVAVICGSSGPPGFSCYSSPLFVRDGAVSVAGCAMGDTVRFVLPPP